MSALDAHTTLHRYRQRGFLLLTILFIGSLLLLAMAIWSIPDVIVYLPFALAGVLLLYRLFSYPLANMAVLLFGFVVLTDYNPGLQISEVVYGLYFLAFLAHWMITRLFLYREPILQTPVDRGVMAMLALTTCYIPVAFLFQGNPYSIFAEWSALVLLAFYFPIKEIVRDHRRGATVVLAALGFIGLFVTLRNFANYREILIQATQDWQVARGRVSTNDNLLMIASTLGITLLVFARQWTHKTLALGAFALYFSGLLLTQSRGYWLAFLVSAGFLFLNVDRPVRRRMIAYAAGGSLILLVLGFVFLQDYMTLVFGGLIERLLSLKTAASVDISLVNRFRESAAVWDKIVHNPVLGYGMGVSYDFFDITRGTTDTDAFVHNGYLSLWYKYGLLGLVLMVYIWIVSIRNGIRAYRIRPAAPSVRLAGLITASALTAFLLSCNTSNPFFLNDTLFAFALLMGTANGASDRVLKEVD